MIDLLSAADEIGRTICADAVWHEGHCSWLAPTPQGGSRHSEPQFVLRGLDGTLHKGTAGIGLFLAHLHVATGEMEFRATALGAIRHAIATIDSGTDDAGPGLYAGAGGTAWAAFEIGGRLDAPELHAPATRLVERIQPDAENDLMRGLAGSVVSLLAMRRWLREPLDRAQALGTLLLARAEWSDETTSWPTGLAAHRLENLLGMGHGTSGIALALAELAAATGRNDFAAGARAAVAHEDARFDSEARNWPDLRAATRTGARGPSFVSAWCQGAAGIALSRLRIHALLGDHGLADDARVGLRTTAELTRRALAAHGAEHCLCHGLAGNADILMTGARAFPNDGSGWAQLAEEVAESGVIRYPRAGRDWPCGPGIGRDPSLMLGISGVGYFLLRVADPSVPSVLALDGAASSRAVSERVWSVDTLDG
jgi:lantibiotic biosynthesis protein